MPIADTSNKPSWADRVEQGEDAPLPQLPQLTPTPQLPVSDVGDGEAKVTTEFRENEDGKKVKVLRHYKVERRQVSKSVARRKLWKKFGDAKNDPPGPNAATTVVGEEISLQFISAKEEEQSHEDDMLAKLRSQKTKMVKCRICKEDHWTTQCPFKDKVALPEHLKEEAKPAMTTPEVEEKVKSGKYIPPSMREGANRRGESMTQSRTRDEAATIRVTNLSEDVRDSDLQDLFRPFGQIARIYLAKDKVTGQSKGFAFINFVHREDAARAIASVHGFGYDNLILTVEWAKPSGTT
ncbi:eukaryotic translation initiation factor 3 subunit G [Ixodes scapularis]|uniref:eukaryotic translation initiation factor 3 subunit G n=1 Tax=Ixodes scapularis TaxID=6945 RepID=UPI0011618F1F|nr:eukaryotic translation initiation factor 3 subunit G [Ixodes scapularis]